MRVRIVALLLAATTAHADYLESQRREASAQAVEELLELATWCGQKKLYRSRDDLYELVLKFDTDQPVARRKLRYLKAAGGGWKRTRPPPKTSDRQLNLHPERDRRRREIASRFADALLPTIEKGGATMSLKTRARVLAETFLLDPEQESARALNGEVKVGSRWMLVESRRAKVRQRELTRAARSALAKAPKPGPVEPTEEEKSYGVQWITALDAGRWRVLCSTPAVEAPSYIRAADASDSFFESVFGTGRVVFARRRLLMTDTKQNYQAILSRDPKFTEREYEWKKDMRSAWFSKSRTCIVRGDRPTRIEMAARQPLGFLLQRYFKVSARHGWVWEGVGLYLTHKLTGYRRTTFVRKTGYAEGDARRNAASGKLWEEMELEGADWFLIAAGRIDAGATPDWSHMLSKDVNQMDTLDLLFAYVLGAYLLESHPDKLVGTLKAIGSGKASTAVLQETLGMPLAAIEKRVNRWVREHGRG